MDNKIQPLILCRKCNVYLESRKTKFSYLGHYMEDELPRCPKCGQVYISEEFVEGKMRKVEESLEEK